MARNYEREYAQYHGKPQQIKERASRNKARAQTKKELGAKAVAGKDVDHKDGNPLNNSKSNRQLLSPSANRSKK